MAGKTYLVTGGAGFIGANFVKYMLRRYQDIQIIVLDKLTYAGHRATIEHELQDPRLEFVRGDIRNRELVGYLFDRYRIDAVANFAAESHVDRSIQHPQLFLETNVLGTQALLDAAKAAWTVGTDEQGYPVYRDGVKFLQVSTDEVYGSLAKGAETEIKLDADMDKVVQGRDRIRVYGDQFFTEQTPLDPRSPYSASKASADLLVQAYAETYHLPVNITRCSNNYGPWHYPEKLIPLTIHRILNGQPIPVYGKGEHVRDWLYVEDHAKAIDIVLEHGEAGQVYNVGGFNEWENLEVVRTIIATIARLIREQPSYRSSLKVGLDEVNDNLITFVEDRLGHDLRYAIHPAKMVTELGWYPETTFEVGMEKTIRWYLEHRQWVETVLGVCPTE